MRASRVAVTAAAAALALAVWPAPSPAAVSPPSLQLAGAKARVSGGALRFELRFVRPLAEGDLVAPGSSVCVRLTGVAVGARVRSVCVAAAGGRLILRAAASARRIPGSVARLGGDRVVITLPARGAGVHDGPLRWQAVTVTGGAGCEVAADCTSAPRTAAGVLVVRALALAAPRTLALGIAVPLRGRGAAPGARVIVEGRRGGVWRTVARATADRGGRFRAVWRRPPLAARLVVRARVGGGIATRPVRIRARTVSLASVGDINLGDGVGAVMGARGPAYPWFGVARTLRRADVAFGNLECSVSTRGRPVPKTFTFRGPPSWLRVVRDYAGLDVVNLANNHTGDYGPRAAADTVRWVRRFGMLGVGAGYSARDAARPRVIERLGLRIAFVGFSDIGPGWFAAGPHSPGTQFASFRAVRAGVAAARRVSDVVIATFHWGIERVTTPTGRQVALARAAIAAGATAVIAAHPHVLQPIVRSRARRLVAYSLGNFVWAAGSAFTARTGILTLQLSSRGVEHARFQRAMIVNTQPRLLGPR